MSYRDDLQAAHNRIAALEADLREAKAKKASAPKSESEQISSLFAHTQSTEEFTRMLSQRLANSRPQVVPMKYPDTRRGYMPLTFSAEGQAGQTITIEQRPNTLFRGDELFATDNSPRPGHGTVINGAFVGVISVLDPWLDVPTWIFYEWLPPETRRAYEVAVKLLGTELETAETRNAAAMLRIANAAMKLKWRTCDTALPIRFQVKFLESCKWQAVLWGDTAR